MDQVMAEGLSKQLEGIAASEEFNFMTAFNETFSQRYRSDCMATPFSGQCVSNPQGATSSNSSGMWRMLLIESFEPRIVARWHNAMMASDGG